MPNALTRSVAVIIRVDLVAPVVELVALPEVFGSFFVARLMAIPHLVHSKALHRAGIDRQWRPGTPANRSADAVLVWYAVVEARNLVGQEHGQPLRRDRDGVVGLRQLARRTGLGHVRSQGGMEGGGDADEDECSKARSVLLRLK